MNFDTFNMICYVWIALAIAVHFLMFYVKAPFGRHTSNKWGPMVDNKLGWIVMELPSWFLMCLFLFLVEDISSSFVWILFVCWIFHYTNRVFIYPLRIKPTDKKMPLFILVNAFVFNIVNAGLNGYYFTFLTSVSDYQWDWVTDPKTILGFLLFFVGLCINWRSDHILINLRRPGEKGYKIPKKFLFRYVSSPNLLGEIMEWLGFAIMAWNLPALTFAVWTYANLVPRAKNHHDWYHSKFEEYPKKRKIVFPFLY